MANSYFRFKQFMVRHDRCAMKVGTDGVLLGATAYGGYHILDIGTGTGLVALMMAQRFPLADITAIDIDVGAIEQAKMNIAESPFHDRINVRMESIARFTTDKCFDSIVCNPPFFENALVCPDEQRATARHTDSMPFTVLIKKIAELLSDDGIATIIIPTDSLKRIEEECAYANIFIKTRLFIRTTEKKLPKRVILALGKQHTEPKTVTHCLMENGERSAWYKDVCKDFYLSKYSKLF